MLLNRFFTLWMCLAIFLLTARLVDGGLIITTNNQPDVYLESTEIIFLSSTNEKIKEEITLEATNKLDNVSGKIYILEGTTKSDVFVLEAQNHGAIAVIETTSLTVAGFLRYRYNDKTIVSQINIPLFEIADKDSDVLLSLVEAGQIQTITILPDEGENPWEIVFTSPGYYIWTSVLFAICAANIGLAVWKFQGFVKYYGRFQASVALFVLILEAISNILRIVSLVDSFGSNGVYNEFTSQSLLNVSFPCGISAYLLLVLYWHEMMTSSSVVVHKFISSMLIPFYIIVAVLLAQNLVMKITGKFVTIDNYFLIITIVYLVIIVALTGLYLSIGIRVLVRLHNSKKMGRKVRHLKATTIKLLTSVFFFVSLVCIGILFVVKVAYSAIGYFVCWYALFTVLNAASMMNILAFRVPSGNSGASTSRQSGVSTQSRSRPQSITNEERNVIEKHFKEQPKPQMNEESESEESDTSAESEPEAGSQTAQ
jgi:hypothetical protein